MALPIENVTLDFSPSSPTERSPKATRGTEPGELAGAVWWNFQEPNTQTIARPCTVMGRVGFRLWA